jgi:hypothetical protein
VELSVRIQGAQWLCERDLIGQRIYCQKTFIEGTVEIAPDEKTAIRLMDSQVSVSVKMRRFQGRLVPRSRDGTRQSVSTNQGLPEGCLTNTRANHNEAMTAGET